MLLDKTVGFSVQIIKQWDVFDNCYCIYLLLVVVVEIILPK